MFILTGDILKKIAPKCNRADSIAQKLTTICPQYGINSANILHEFLANVLHESNEFREYEENLYYSTPERLMKVWPGRFPNTESALPYIKNAQKLADKVYGNRKDLGNIQPGDGWLFRGSGPIQMTGRYMFTLFNAFIRRRFGIIKSMSEVADSIRNDDTIAIHSACWLFSIAKKLNKDAALNNMNAIIKRINGGYTGIERRMQYYELCKALIKDN